MLVNKLFNDIVCLLCLFLYSEIDKFISLKDSIDKFIT